LDRAVKKTGVGRTAILALGLGLVAGALAASHPEPGFSRSLTPGAVAHYRAKFGASVDGRLEGWKGFVGKTGQRLPASPTRDAQALKSVNDFLNDLPYGTDARIWGAADYWATPAEALSVNIADCEDYAIAKYFTLKELGVPVSSLRLVYAWTRLSREAHMVLAYYPSPGSEPMIMDNLRDRIEKASDRPDLTPVFTFNEEDLMQVNLPGVRTSPLSHRRWAELLQKLRQELRY
jgi:predicted transglutaminase-like cysteine proteinase